MSEGIHASERCQELMARLAEPSKRKQRGGTLAWIEGHDDRELIETLLVEHAKRHASGQGISHDEFVERVLAPEFGYPYEGAAVRTYVLKHHPQTNGAKG